MARRPWSEQTRAERWGLIGAVIAPFPVIPYILHLGGIGVGLAVGAACLVGIGLGRLAAAVFPEK